MDILEKNFDISNTIEVDELAKRWGVSKKTIDNRRYRGQGPSYFKIGGKILTRLQSYIRDNAKKNKVLDNHG